MTNRRDIERFLRVDHAGERAAQQIYKGQLVVLRNHSSGEEIQHMMEQEIELEWALLNEEAAGTPLCSGPCLGCRRLSAGPCHRKHGAKGSMAYTIAVEEVIGDHYTRRQSSLVRMGRSAQDHFTLP